MTWAHALNSGACPECPVYLQMPIGWNGLSMPTIMCVCIPTGRVYFKARGVDKDCVPYMVNVELTNIPVKWGNIYPWCKLIPLWSWLGPGAPSLWFLSCLVWTYVLFVGCALGWFDGSFRCSLYLPLGPTSLSYVFFITSNVPILVAVDDSTLPVLGGPDP